METGIRRARDIRVALSALLALSVGLANREASTVLLPAVTGPVWEVGGGRASRAVSGGHGAHGGGDAADAHARERGLWPNASICSWSRLTDSSLHSCPRPVCIY